MLVKLSSLGDLTSKEILINQIALANTIFFFVSRRRNFLNILEIEEVRSLINSLKDILSFESDENKKTDALSIISMLYKKLKNERLAEIYYMELLRSPNVNKVIWWDVRKAFPQFKNYKCCEAWRAVKPY